MIRFLFDSILTVILLAIFIAVTAGLTDYIINLFKDKKWLD